ncbi:Proteasome activator complex subunit 4 like protein, partial [Aduncisulcus paluster]
ETIENPIDILTALGIPPEMASMMQSLPPEKLMEILESLQAHQKQSHPQSSKKDNSEIFTLSKSYDVRLKMREALIQHLQSEAKKGRDEEEEIEEEEEEEEEEVEEEEPMKSDVHGDGGEEETIENPIDILTALGIPPEMASMMQSLPPEKLMEILESLQAHQKQSHPQSSKKDNSEIFTLSKSYDVRLKMREALIQHLQSEAKKGSEEKTLLEKEKEKDKEKEKGEEDTESGSFNDESSDLSGYSQPPQDLTQFHPLPASYVTYAQILLGTYKAHYCCDEISASNRSSKSGSGSISSVFGPSCRLPKASALHLTVGDNHLCHAYNNTAIPPADYALTHVFVGEFLGEHVDGSTRNDMRGDKAGEHWLSGIYDSVCGGEDEQMTWTDLNYAYDNIVRGSNNSSTEASKESKRGPVVFSCTSAIASLLSPSSALSSINSSYGETQQLIKEFETHVPESLPPHLSSILSTLSYFINSSGRAPTGDLCFFVGYLASMCGSVIYETLIPFLMAASTPRKHQDNRHDVCYGSVLGLLGSITAIPPQKAVTFIPPLLLIFLRVNRFTDSKKEKMRLHLCASIGIMTIDTCAWLICGLGCACGMLRVPQESEEDHGYISNDGHSIHRSVRIGNEVAKAFNDTHDLTLVQSLSILRAFLTACSVFSSILPSLLPYLIPFQSLSFLSSEHAALCGCIYGCFGQATHVYTSQRPCVGGVINNEGNSLFSVNLCRGIVPDNTPSPYIMESLTPFILKSLAMFPVFNNASNTPIVGSSPSSFVQPSTISSSLSSTHVRTLAFSLSVLYSLRHSHLPMLPSVLPALLQHTAHSHRGIGEWCGWIASSSFWTESVGIHVQSLRRCVEGLKRSTEVLSIKGEEEEEGEKGERISTTTGADQKKDESNIEDLLGLEKVGEMVVSKHISTSIPILSSISARLLFLRRLENSLFLSFKELQNSGILDTLRDTLMQLLCDSSLEVQRASARVLAVYFRIVEKKNRIVMLRRIGRLCKSKSTGERYGGVCVLCECVLAHPDSIPRWIARVICKISMSFAHDKANVIQMLVRETFRVFMNQHKEMWAQEKMMFSEEELRSKSTGERYGGVCVLCECVLAHPDSIPRWIARVICKISMSFAHDKANVIQMLVRETFRVFMNQHKEMWAQEKMMFSEEELRVINEVLASQTNIYI